MLLAGGVLTGAWRSENMTDESTEANQLKHKIRGGAQGDGEGQKEQGDAKSSQ
jgi:hypothetical protein